MATEALSEDFITIVPVGENRLAGAVRDSAFVTVLTVGAAAGAAEVVVRRPRGARLGLGLKFEGGSAAAEKVRRLLVQSCAEDSPAANACAPWGNLIPGDEILAIDGVSVADLTRIDCVRRLKDSDEVLTLLVRHFESDGTDYKQTDTPENMSQKTEILRPTTLPPPVPPRKLGKKNSFKDKTTLQTVGEQNTLFNPDGYNQLPNGKDTAANGQHIGVANVTKLSRKSSFDSHIHRQNKEGIACLRKGSPEEVRRLVRRLSDGKAMPPDAEVYIDLLSTEWERCLLLADAESDDTGSSISTVVDRLSSMASSVENSIPSTPIMQPKTIDIQKVLNCIENIDSNILRDMTTSKLLEKHMDNNIDCKVEKVISANLFHNIENNISSGENGITSVAKEIHNDKNNNSTIIHSLVSNNETTKSSEDLKPEIAPDKPKPMPRNTRVERSLSEKKLKSISVPETPPPPIPETLLTPTKKNCIETWLQRSEAEMNNKTVEKLDDVSVVPEVLPRLIDFVPKPQFKESGNDLPPLPRPTSAPPPPPPDTREDGSGASLDTIGELDESSDTIDGKPYKPIVIENEKNDRKSFERSYWEDRINKSDNEDKSLSNDETPPPTCPRQPPDGVETPSDVVEKIPDLPTRLPPRLPSGWPNSRTRFSYTSRTQDARSEASVKDKIAMFSNDHAISTDHLDKCGTLPAKTSSVTRKSTIPYTTNYSEVSTLDRRLTKSQDNLDDLPRYKRNMDRPEVLGSVESAPTNNHNTMTNSKKQVQSDSKPLFYGSTTAISAHVEPPFTQTVYHVRSSSDDNSNKNTQKSNLEYLIEQRKKSMSKLRGLVIPEQQGPIVDLPEIKVQDSIAKMLLIKPTPVANNCSKVTNKSSNLKPTILSDESKWKASLLPNNLPKYSPAFKRKSLQVYTPSSLSKESTPERKLYEKCDTATKNSNILNHNTFRTSLDTKTKNSDKLLTSTLPSKFSTSNMNKLPNKDYRDILNGVRDFKNVEIKICTATEVVDSDNDSAMSSTQSSYRSSASSPMHTLDTIESDSSRLSPKISHYATYSTIKSESNNKTSILDKTCEEYIKRDVCRSVSSDTNVSLSSSAGSAATSGSQASCSSLESSVADSDKKKISKSYNIDTINRRNILASAKCRSGRDAKLKSPVIEAKFSHESYDRSPSPTRKTSDRLSTLTSSVSAVLNKGENRRRSKVIAETDSDSDDELNVRQRKNDFKNTRLKRNSSTGNKKQVDTIDTKIEDAPKHISEKIIKEIKKAGLDNYSYKKNNSLSTTDKNIIKIETTTITKKEESIIKKETIVPKKEKTMTRQKSSDSVDNNISNSPIIIQTKVSTIEKNESSSSEDVNVPTQKIYLKKGAANGVGLILAGGIDCEAKDVTVHRVLPDSVAAKAGLQRGVKVRSINGCTMNGLTHAQSVTILKEQRSEVVIEIEYEIKENKDHAKCGSEKAESKGRNSIAETETGNETSNVVTVMLEKAGGGAGLGFGLDGGRDSPQGDRPLTIKKLFAGGAAAQSGRILVGAELLSAGGQSLDGFTRTQAWAALKALPTGPVALVLKNPKVL